MAAPFIRLSFLVAILLAATPAQSANRASPSVQPCVDHFLALASNGSLFDWGSYQPQTQASNFGFGQSSPLPFAEMPPAIAANAIACGQGFSLVLADDGSVWGYGWNGSGQLGPMTTPAVTTPTAIGGLPPIRTLSASAGGRSVLALDASGNVWGWGENLDGQILPAQAARVPSVAPQRLSIPASSPIVAVSAGISHSLALEQSGKVWIWGTEKALYGQTGRDHFSYDVVDGLPSARKISAGGLLSLVLAADGTVWAWGDNAFGALGTGFPPGLTDSTRPMYRSVPARIPSLGNATSISAGFQHSIAMLADGSVWSWGSNVNGEIGNGNFDTFSPSATALLFGVPIPVKLNTVGPVQSVAAGVSGSVAIGTGGEVLAWGGNFYGRLGDGTFKDRSQPQAVLGPGGTGFLDLTPEDPLALSADKVPAFFVTSSGSAGSSAADPVSVTTEIRFRQQDQGLAGGVYTFAVAPESLVVKSASGEAPFVLGKSKPANGSKDTPVSCVLAQLNGSGQLQAVSASSLQAYVSGVLSSAGQAVQVINGVATANISGATFYVGYGSSSSAMINNGINRSVVNVPGVQVCQPQPPQTGWWWNQAEDGRGYTIESTGSKLFFAAYLYDITGRSTWYISAGPTSLDGSVYLGQLESYSNGQTLTGAFRSPVRPPVLNGQLTLAFSDSTHGSLVWPGGTVPITRMEFGVGGVNAVPQANQPENGWWLSGLDDGRGFFIEWQAGVAFMAGFMYDDTGAPVWYIAAKPRTDNAQAFSSQWEKYVNGQTLTGTYHPPVRPPTYVGAATIQFQGAETAIMTMPGGRQVNLSRYRF